MRLLGGRGRRWRDTAALLTCLGGCGDPLVEADYLGERVGSVPVRTRAAQARHDAMQVGFFWMTDVSDAAPRGLHQLVEQTAARRSLVLDDDTTRVILFAEPAPTQLVAWDGDEHGSGPRVGVGVVAAFFDENDSGELDGEESWQWHSSRRFVVWAPSDLPAVPALGRVALPAGLHVSMGLPCAPDPGPTQDGCEVDLLDACDVTACPQGLECTDAWGSFANSGSRCLAPASHPCEPASSRLVVGPDGSAAFAPRCASSADCPPPTLCDPLLRVCVPLATPGLDEDAPLRAACATR